MAAKPLIGKDVQKQSAEVGSGGDVGFRRVQRCGQLAGVGANQPFWLERPIEMF
jgi:hypothetical protein